MDSFSERRLLSAGIPTHPKIIDVLAPSLKSVWSTERHRSYYAHRPSSIVRAGPKPSRMETRGLHTYLVRMQLADELVRRAVRSPCTSLVGRLSIFTRRSGGKGVEDTSLSGHRADCLVDTNCKTRYIYTAMHSTVASFLHLSRSVRDVGVEGSCLTHSFHSDVANVGNLIGAPSHG